MLWTFEHISKKKLSRAINNKIMFNKVPGVTATPILFVVLQIISLGSSAFTDKFFSK